MTELVDKLIAREGRIDILGKKFYKTWKYMLGVLFYLRGIKTNELRQPPQ